MEREHILQFDVAGKKSTSKQVCCTYPYDVDEIMRFGHTLAEQVPEDPACAEFPAQPWNTLVVIGVKKFRSLWKLPSPFKNQEIEVGSEELLEAIWEGFRQKDQRFPEFAAVGLTPRSLSIEMKVTMPKRDVMVVVGAVVNGNCFGITCWIRSRDCQMRKRSGRRAVLGLVFNHA
jgi:hypothetical protein